MHPLGSFLSLVGTLSQVGAILGMAPPDWGCRSVPKKEKSWTGHWGDPPPLRIWAPHMENLGEGEPAFLGRRCPGVQQTGNPFRIDESPLPGSYDPNAYPNSDVVACVRLATDGVVLKVQLVGGTGSPALDRRLLRTLYREWRFAPANGGEVVRGWQRIRLNSAARDAPVPGPLTDPLLM
jgi:hypothetical protein